jgi:hypothetical protein
VCLIDDAGVATGQFCLVALAVGCRAGRGCVPDGGVAVAELLNGLPSTGVPVGLAEVVAPEVVSSGATLLDRSIVRWMLCLRSDAF